MSPQRAAFLEPLACVVQGQAQVPLQADDTVVVMGCGTIGLLHVMLAKERGARRIIVSGRHRQRLDLAAELGATDLVDVDSQDTRQVVQRLTQGRGAELVIECIWEITSDGQLRVEEIDSESAGPRGFGPKATWPVALKQSAEFGGGGGERGFTGWRPPVAAHGTRVREPLRGDAEFFGSGGHLVFTAAAR